MTHARIEQFHFTRAEWLRGLEGLTDEDGARHFGPMNCISWTVGHMTWHEQRYWLEFHLGQIPYPELNKLFAYGAPMNTPVLSEMLSIWQSVTQLADPFLDGLTAEALLGPLKPGNISEGRTVGSGLLRMTYHYWYHTGEVQAIRQMLGHTGLAEYVGNIEKRAPFRPE